MLYLHPSLFLRESDSGLDAADLIRGMDRDSTERERENVARLTRFSMLALDERLP